MKTNVCIVDLKAALEYSISQYNIWHAEVKNMSFKEAKEKKKYWENIIDKIRSKLESKIAEL